MVELFALLVPIFHSNAQLKDTDPERVEPGLLIHPQVSVLILVRLLAELFCRLQVGIKFLFEVVPCYGPVSALAGAGRARSLILHQLVQGILSLILILRLLERDLLLGLVLDLVQHLVHVLDHIDWNRIILGEVVA